MFQTILSTFIKSRGTVITKNLFHRLFSDAAMGDIAAMRINYETKDKLDIDKLPTTDPFQLFNLWFDDARHCKEIVEPNAMTLATADKNGIPSARMVLLKGFDIDGFQFYSNYGSRKADELEKNPNAALLFYWHTLHRQVRIEGTVERLAAAVSDDYFHSRPHDSQLGSSASQQSTPIASHQVLLDSYSKLKNLYPSKEHTVPRPQSWGGYLVVPHSIEFWQGESNRLHRRVQFKREIKDDIDKNIVREGSSGWFYYIISS